MSDTLEDIDTSQLDNVGRVKVDTPSNVTILDMTEDCTRLVFDRLTLNQLIHLRAVCHAWTDIIADICENKQTLQLFFSKESVSEYCFHTTRLNVQDEPQFKLNIQNLLLISPKLDGLDSSEALKRARDGSFSEQQNDPNLGIRFIARLFPNITNFVWDIQHDRMFELNYILWKWSTNLHTLTIFSATFAHICQNALHDFVKCFEQMSSLRRLHLLGDSQIDIPKVQTFGQLEEFTFDNPKIKFSPYFAQLDANSCKILRVRDYLESLFFSIPNTPINFADVNPELVSKLTHLLVSFLYAQKNHISHHSDIFPNLTHLEIVNIYRQPLAYVLQQIVPLQKLQILTLNLQCTDGMEPYFIFNPNYRNTFPIFHNTITQLRLLDNDSESYFPEFEEYQLLAKTFPMVREIRVYSNNLNAANFDAQYRPRFRGAFGERVKVIFFPTNKFNIDDF